MPDRHIHGPWMGPGNRRILEVNGLQDVELIWEQLGCEELLKASLFGKREKGGRSEVWN